MDSIEEAETDVTEDEKTSALRANVIAEKE